MKTLDFSRIYVGGRWVDSTATGTIPVIDPATETELARIPEGNDTDVDLAVAAACDAFDSWASTPPKARGELLARLADALDARRDELADLVTSEVGCPVELARVAQAALPVDHFAFYAELAKTYPWEEPLGASTVVRAPVGVVGAITPWNVPLNQIALKVAPALLAGCTVVLKPSEVAPLNAWALMDAAGEVELPAGILNLVSGAGAVGEALVRHPEVDMISFTGSVATGKRIAALAADTVKRVILEMGGKSANIILDDADLDRALPAGLQHCYQNNGQVCAALSRMLVPRSTHDEVVERVRQLAEAVTVGDPRSGAQLGPLVSGAQQERVRRYIRTGSEEGARLVTGGPDAPEGLELGYYVRPTVFADVDTSMTIAQEEIFGPVLVIIPYDDEDDAVRIANDTRYGLSGAVWSADPDRAERVARRLRTGQVMVNGAVRPRGAPFGGFKQSGVGREFGRYGLDEYVEIQLVARPEH